MTYRSRPRITVKRRVLRDDVYDTLLHMIIGTDIPSGAPLSIDGLARDLDVSPTPVREALVQLESTGLVTRTALKGYRVAEPLTPDQMWQLMDARTVIELATTEKAGGNVRSLIPELEKATTHHSELVAELDRVRSKDNVQFLVTVRKYFEVDWLFHQAIARHAGNNFLYQMLTDLGAQVHRFRQIAMQGTPDAEQALSEHIRILQAFKQNDVNLAVEAMKDHLAAVRERSTGIPHELLHGAD